MKQEQQKKRGGARPGSGRPRGTPTKTLSYRVPQRHTETIHKLITNLLKNYKNENNLEHA